MAGSNITDFPYAFVLHWLLMNAYEGCLAECIPSLGCIHDNMLICLLAMEHIAENLQC